MRISFPPPAPEVIRRLEAAAAARPALYRMRLALLALAGDVILTFVRVVPFAAAIVFGVVLVHNTYFYVLAAFVMMLLIWAMRPGYRDSGKSIERKDAPELYAALDDLKTKLDVGRRMDVRLDDRINAGAREARGLFGLIGTRRVLTLGVPLLACSARMRHAPSSRTSLAISPAVTDGSATGSTMPISAGSRRSTA